MGFPEYDGPVEITYPSEGVMFVRRAEEPAPVEPPAPVEIPEDDEYGLCLDDGWEDPFAHDYCAGCDMCRPWEGMSYDVIRGRRKAYVATLRMRGHR